jgi:hypothetical protein
LLGKRLIRIDPAEVTFVRRGFAPSDACTVAQLERVAAHFVQGFHAAVEEPRAGRLGPILDRIEPELRGFAFEGAGMALALLDRLTPWNRSRLRDLIEGSGSAHVYMVIIGAGWAWARLGTRLAPRLESLDPVLRWLALDGYGFHEGYFYTRRTVEEQAHPKRVRGYARTAFDAGLGRSLWFVCGGDPERVHRQVECFDADRRADLWAGIGLACSYAGGVDVGSIAAVRDLSGAHVGALAQGAAFAAKARERAGIVVPDTRIAVEEICRTSLELAAKQCDSALAALPSPGASGPPAFETWRREIRRAFERSFGIGEDA